jgi:hypothetical protein
MFRPLLLLALAVLAGCTRPAPSKVPLADIVASPRAYNGQTVTTCGWATNQFEDINMYVSADGSGGGLSLLWCAGAPKTKAPTYQCVTGTINTFAGMSVAAADGHPAPGEPIVISTATPFRWEVDQSCAAAS